MDFSQIKELITLLQNSNIGEFDLKQKGFSLSIRTDKYTATSVVTHAAPIVQTTAPVPVAPTTHQTSPATNPIVETKKEETPTKTAETKTNYFEIKSPMVGTFYRSSSPEKPAFAKVGDIIKVDDVLCLIEAMKLFNEVRSEVSGKIVKVLLENASPVEYDQPLFLVEPV